VQVADLRKLVLLDLIANNADRKAEHCLSGPNGSLWGIDHGLTFHAQPKLRTVLWHFAGMEFQADEKRTLANLVRALDDHRQAHARQLKELLDRAEWLALRDRAGRLAAAKRFPDPRYKHVPYRW
jgi:uncharacterized repeat protein (TIGR03843 family)